MVEALKIYDDSGWIDPHRRYARDQQEVADFRAKYHITPAGETIIAIQSKTLDFIPKQTHLSRLFENFKRKIWALVSVFDEYYSYRSDSSYLAPSFGPIERQEADIAKLENYLQTETDETRKAEALKLITLLEKGIKEPNEMIAFAQGKRNQFIQI